MKIGENIVVAGDVKSPKWRSHRVEWYHVVGIDKHYVNAPHCHVTCVVKGNYQVPFRSVSVSKAIT